MSEPRTPILDHQAILVKIDRMACEICEKHTETKEILVCGMNSRGFDIAGRMAAKIKEFLPGLQVTLLRVDTHSGPEVVFSPAVKFDGQKVLVVDDVINTGKTLMDVVQKVFNQGAASIETAFLAKREHRNFPVKADYVGISLATTLQEHVVFDNSNTAALQVYLN
jgi:pyrimidine operon attenuation protein/uracil phosphoribosyltransferase